jgi:hypothetical protein
MFQRRLDLVERQLARVGQRKAGRQHHGRGRPVIAPSQEGEALEDRIVLWSSMKLR